MDSVKGGDRWGPYVFEERVGAGGMAEAWRARRVGADDFQCPVCIKLIHPRFFADPHALDLLREEAAIGARCSHPNIVRTEDFAVHDGRYGLVMEFVPGTDLATLSKQRRDRGLPCPPAAAAFVTHELLLALVEIHRSADAKTGAPLGVVHSDVSPTNVLVNRSGAVKLGDFGIARSPVRNETDEGIVRGKPWYMPLEQLTGRPTDARADLHALGVTLYELLTGRKPWWDEKRAATFAEIQARMDEGGHPPLTALRPDVGQSFAALIESLIARETNARPPSAQEALRVLRAAVPTCMDGASFQAWIAKLDAPGATSADRVDVEPSLAVAPTETAPTLRTPPPAVATKVERPGRSRQLAAARGFANRFVVGGAVVLAALAIAAIGIRSSVRPTNGAAPRTAAAHALDSSSRGAAPIERAAATGGTTVSTSIGADAAVSPTTSQMSTPTDAAATPSNVAEPATGQLSVVVLPWADVFVDGRYRGQSPRMLRLSVGTHTVMVNGGVPRQEQRVMVRAGHVTAVRVVGN